jgi:hypothetical protein
MIKSHILFTKGSVTMEEWKDIEGFEGCYQVSNYGRVKSLPRVIEKSNGKKHTIRGGILSTYTRKKDGYVDVTLKDHGDAYCILVHILVAKAFCPGYKEGFEVRHKIEGFEGRSYNHADNLEWMTSSEQALGRETNNIKKAQDAAAITHRKPIEQYDLKGNLLAKFPSIRDAQKSTGVRSSKISLVVNGHKKMAGGFAWRFAN